MIRPTPAACATEATAREKTAIAKRRISGDTELLFERVHRNEPVEMSPFVGVRWRAFSALDHVRSPMPVLTVLVFLTVALLSGCGGHSTPAEKQPSATGTTASATTTSSSSRPAPPAGRNVPVAFSPLSFTAVNESDYWVLGSSQCRTGKCLAILRTTNGGGSFASIPAPPLPTLGATPALRFADHLDGFAFVPGVGGALYATHDGGSSWHRLSLGTPLAFATGGGNVYLVTARCSLQRCRGYRFERSPVDAESWSSTRLPFAPDGSILDLAAHGSHLWLLGTTKSNQRMQHDTLARSSDGGRSFVSGTGPCYPGLGGNLAPSSPSVVWAVCPTGMLAGASRSSDGGVTFTPLRTPPMANSSRLAPASDTTAVIAGNGAGSKLLRTTDGGATWRAAKTPVNSTYSPWIGFTDAEVGAALVQIGSASHWTLWRTTDGGSDWSKVKFR
jgi:hypothetical protein